LVTTNSAGAVRGLGRVNAALGGTEGRAQKTTRAIAQMGKVTALAAGGVAVASTKLAIDFDKSMRNVNSIAQLPEKSLVRLSKRVRELGGRTAQSPRTLAEGLYDLVSSGFDADESLRILGKSARAASAGLTTTEVSTKAVAAVLNAYRRPAKDAGRVSDSLFRTVDRGVITFEELAQNIGDTLPFAASLGVTLEEVGAATATMTKQGLGAPETFTRIRNVIQTLIKPGEDLSKAYERLGVEGGEELIKKTGGLQAALQSIVGTTDGTKRAIAGLFPNIRSLGGVLALTGDNSRSAAQDLKGMRDSSGATARALSQQSQSIAYQWNRLKAQAESLAIGFGNQLLPAISKVLKVLSDPKLTGEQKFNRVAEMLGDMVSRAIPVIANAAAQAAPKVVEAFVKGWLAADAWARLLVGAWLFTKLGGWKAFFGVGAKGGVAVGAGMATGTATGLKGKLPGLLKGLGIAGLVTAIVGPDLIRALSQVVAKSPETQARLKFREAVEGAKNFADLERRVMGAREALTRFHHTGTNLRAPVREMNQGVDRTTERFAQLREPVERARRIIDRMAEGSSQSIRSLRTNVRIGTEGIKNALGENTKAGKDALTRHFIAAAQNARRSMREAGKATKEGTQFIEEMMVRALQGMGFTKEQALNVRKGRDPDKGTPIGAPLVGKQRGGFIDMGAPTGDSVAALLEKDEYVLNRRAVRKVGRKALDALNFGVAPRFQGGGIVELLHPGNDPAHHDHLHVAMKTPAMIVALGRRLQRMGWLVAEHPAFGGVGGGHAPQGYHYTGQAIDVNWPDASQERAKIAALLPMLGGSMAGLGAVAPKLARLIATGPDSPLKTLVQGALDTTRAAAQDVVNRAGAPIEGAEIFTGGGDPAANRALGLQMAKARGWGGANWRALDYLWGIGESAWDHHADNPTSSAYGIPQAMAHLYPETATSAWRNNPAAQIQWGLDYIAGRYGDPMGALAFWRAQSPHWYSRGGLAGMTAGGPPKGSPLDPQTISRAAGAVPGRAFAKTLKAFSRLTKKGYEPKKRSQMLRKLEKRLRDVGLPASLAHDIGALSENAELFGDMASRASQLTVDPFEEGGEPILGVVGGKTEAQWITDQLATLFQLRNKLIRAEEIIVERRRQIAAMVERAQKRLKAIAEAIRAAAKVKRDHQGELETLEKRLGKAKKPATKKLIREEIKARRGKIKTISGQQRERERNRKIIKDRLIPALTGKRSALNTLRGDTLSTLGEVQGIGGPMERLSTLPAVGVLGGQIFDAQIRLRDLAEKPAAVTDTATGEESESAELLRQLLREANLRTAVSEAQFQALRNMPPYGGQFAEGGVVPGPVGAPRTVIAHGGEAIGQPGDVNVHLHIAPGMEWLRRFVRVEVEQGTRRQARGAVRPLPGRGGGGLG
jgi:TP901 family phage tail tape measure protein